MKTIKSLITNNISSCLSQCKSFTTRNILSPFIFPLLFGIISSTYCIYLSITDPFYFLSYMPDDAFYYFEISKNLLDGYFFSFDTITYTNGFHPLWLLIITPLTYLNLNILYYNLLGIFLTTLSILIFTKLLKNLFSKNFSIIFSLLLSFNPFIFLFSVNGLETSLLLFFISIIFYLYFTLDLSKSTNLIIIGFFSGLTFLSRTDSILLLVIIFLIFFFSKQEFCLIKKIKLSLIWILSSAIITTPWLIFNLIKFGNPIQESGSALKIIFLREMVNNNNWITLDFYHHFMNLLLGNFEWLGIFSGYNYLFLLLLFPLTFFLMIKLKTKNQLYFFLSYAGYFFLIIIISAYRMAPREWYLAPFIGLVIFMITYLIIYIHKEYSDISFKYIICVSFILAIGILMFNAGILTEGMYPHQKEIPKSSYCLNTCFSENDRIGSSDAGIFKYYANFKVINLDGLVNHEAYKHIKDGSLYDFLKNYDIKFFMIRNSMQDDWFMGEGTGLLYSDYLINCNNSTQAKIPQLNILKMLQNNSEVYNTYFKEKIVPNDFFAKKFFGKGWSIDETNGTWSCGKYSKIYLPLSEKKVYDLIIKMNSYKNPKGYVKVKIFVDNELSHAFKVVNSPDEYKLKIKPSHIITEILFEYETTYNLREMGISDDSRDLSVYLTEIFIKEL